MRKIFFSKKALRRYIHTNYPGAAYQYSKKLFFYILDGLEVEE